MYVSPFADRKTTLLNNYRNNSPPPLSSCIDPLALYRRDFFYWRGKYEAGKSIPPPPLAASRGGREGGGGAQGGTASIT